MISATKENTRLEELVSQCQDRESLENWVILTCRLESLSQWVGIDSLGFVLIFDKKPKPGPMPGWWDEHYVPLRESCSPSFEEKLKEFAGLVFTANDLLAAAAKAADNVYRRDIQSRNLVHRMLCRIQSSQIRLEQEKSKQLMRQMLDYFRKKKHPHPDLQPMLSTFKRFNYED